MSELTLHNELQAAQERISNLEASNASLIARNNDLTAAMRLIQAENDGQAAIITRAGLKEYAPHPFRSNRELLGMLPQKRMENL